MPTEQFELLGDAKPRAGVDDKILIEPLIGVADPVAVLLADDEDVVAMLASVFLGAGESRAAQAEREREKASRVVNRGGAPARPGDAPRAFDRQV
jgi:hypothetical protein